MKKYLGGNPSPLRFIPEYMPNVNSSKGPTLVYRHYTRCRISITQRPSSWPPLDIGILSTLAILPAPTHPGNLQRASRSALKIQFPNKQTIKSRKPSPKQAIKYSSPQTLNSRPFPSVQFLRSLHFIGHKYSAEAFFFLHNNRLP